MGVYGFMYRVDCAGGGRWQEKKCVIESNGPCATHTEKSLMGRSGREDVVLHPEIAQGYIKYRAEFEACQSGAGLKMTIY